MFIRKISFVFVRNGNTICSTYFLFLKRLVKMKRKSIVMGSDNFSFGDCPKAKKSKTSREAVFTSYWAHLPSVLLHDIFDLLSKEDRKNASAVCKHWRQNIFHPKWWPAMTFKIEQNNIQKARFYIYTFGKIVSEAKIKLYSLSVECMEEFINLLQLLSENNNLKSLIIEPTHCRFELPAKLIGNSIDDPWDIMTLLKPTLPKLSRFSIGCIEDLTYFLEDILKNLSPMKVTHLGLASVKDDPLKYEVSYFDPELIVPFTKLKVLSVDYDQLSDEFLYKLEAAKDLERLVVHLHGVRKNHPNTTDKAWIDFQIKHPTCEFRLTIIHAFKDIEDIHETVMRRSMPLSHLKVFFCESLNLEVVQNLSSHYVDTLRSIIWVDSLSDNDNSWIFVKPSFDESPDPFVLAAWLCKNLEEFVLYGYKYWEENLVAISRLRGENLKRLEMAEHDIFSPDSELEDALTYIPESLRKPWKPMQQSKLHPVICNPTDGDSDEYLLPIVLADLH